MDFKYEYANALTFVLIIATVVGTGIVLLLAPGWGLRHLAKQLKIASSTVPIKLKRQQGQLQQQDSLPFLGHDGGRGPAGGRMLLPRRFGGSAAMQQAIVAWLLATMCFVILFWTVVTGNTELRTLATLAFVCLLLMATIASRRWAISLDHNVEVEAWPPAVGDRIRIHASNRLSNRQEPVHIRMRLVEHVLSRVGGVPGWTEEVLWDEPVSHAEVALQPPWRSQFMIRIPEQLPGTYLAPGYRLEWIIEVGDGLSFTDYPFPVVK